MKVGDIIEYTGTKYPTLLGIPSIIEHYDDCTGLITISGKQYRSYEREEGKDGVGYLKKCRELYQSPDEKQKIRDDRIKYFLDHANMVEFNKNLSKQTRKKRWLNKK